MDLRKVKKLIELVEESGIAELEVKSGEEAVRISRYGTGNTALVQQPVVAHAAVVEPGEHAGSAVGSASPAAQSTTAGRTLNAPLAGTFYIASAPGAAAFVALGDQITKGQPMCIIESMKMMNTIEAEFAGTLKDVLVANGEPVEAGQPLFTVA